MTEDQRLELRRQRDDEVRAQAPHNRRPMGTSLADLRRRRQRRKTQGAMRHVVEEWRR